MAQRAASFLPFDEEVLVSRCSSNPSSEQQKCQTCSQFARVLSGIKDISAIMYKMLMPGPNPVNLVDGAVFCGQLEWLSITEHM